MLPSEEIKRFLDNLDQWKEEYKQAYELMKVEDKRLQDLLHAIEFSEGKSERNRLATKLRNSRRLRRQYKDKVLLYENIITFLEDGQNKRVVNLLSQLLGKQRKQEKTLTAERIYIPRVEGKEGGE
ncbi:MAG: hypothetical protein IJP31_06535 [Lachnospiraceae bacterium]|nr:hypothetical protein [Lachnospiraceae bacterium]